MEPITVLQLPHNGREGPLASPVDDGSGRTYPLPHRVTAILDHEGVCVRLTADGVVVPEGAIPLLWKRIHAHNHLVALSQPPDVTQGRIAALRRRMRAEAEAEPDHEAEP